MSNASGQDVLVWASGRRTPIATLFDITPMLLRTLSADFGRTRSTVEFDHLWAEFGQILSDFRALGPISAKLDQCRRR